MPIVSLSDTYIGNNITQRKTMSKYLNFTMANLQDVFKLTSRHGEAIESVVLSDSIDPFALWTQRRAHKITAFVFTARHGLHHLDARCKSKRKQEIEVVR